MSKRILFTGGGSAGHVTVNVALIPRLIALGWDASYIGSFKGIESDLISNMKEDIDYYGISTGKLRRYMSIENLKDPFRIVKGVYQAYQLIRRIKPDILFSKGGFVSVPVIIGAKLNKVPIIIHESDITPGLANTIALPLANKICVTFPETLEHIKGDKATYVGAIIRDELRSGDATRGLNFLQFNTGKPVILVMGGSLGSKKINETIRSNLALMLDQFHVVHICGKGQLEPSIQLHGYQQFEYLHEELSDVIASADFVVTRAGSNSIFEFLALRKPMLLIPLSKAASRGDQILNAESFEKAGYAEVLLEEELTNESFILSLHTLISKQTVIVKNMAQQNLTNPIDAVIHLIQETSK
ncbi:undecaprenyldiphospho-muramoylpentapeptide beta-N-acetylglucosaminyltransferase [Paenibacillus sp. CMAA1364]